MKFILGAIGVIIVVFFLLGLKSQKGKAKGLVDGHLAAPGSAPNCVSSEVDVQPEKKVAPLNGTLDAIKAAIIETGGTITSETPNYVSATYMSSIFKFVDDVEIRHDKENIWHIRSASRVGYSDRGVNRKRVEAIRAEIK
ncbi:DUF1499 domain-containing protein [Hellea balneolensis]|uniref:DUF1499 domain-containing protein n=1 Tax=Hellea balneolensis TaxID=287478 RepID=UPI00041E6732|nr:DUF1499 domain-containing protein [Hellea balneolensis]